MQEARLMAIQVLAGSRWHLARRAVNGPSLQSGSALASYPVDNICSGDPGEPFVAAAAGLVRVLYDLQLAQNAGFETGALAPGWAAVTTGTGAVTVQGTTKSSGSYGLKVAPGAAGTAYAYQDFVVPAAEAVTFSAKMRVGATGSAIMRVYNVDTGEYLTSGLAWSGSSADADTEAGTAFVRHSKLATAKTIASQQGGGYALEDTVTLRLILACETASQEAYFDEIEVFPSVSFTGLWHARVKPVQAVTVESSDDAAAFTTRATLSALSYRRACYSVFSSVAARYWRLSATAGPLAFRAAEWVVSQPATVRQPRHPEFASWGLAEAQPQVRPSGGTGRPFASPLLESPVRALTLPFRHAEQAEAEQLYDLLVRRSGFGQLPSVVVPNDSLPDVIWCSLAPGQDASLVAETMRDVALSLQEWPGPIYGL
jgi:hypothetical protein